MTREGATWESGSTGYWRSIHSVIWPQLIGPKYYCSASQKVVDASLCRMNVTWCKESWKLIVNSAWSTFLAADILLSVYQALWKYFELAVVESRGVYDLQIFTWSWASKANPYNVLATWTRPPGAVSIKTTLAWNWLPPRSSGKGQICPGGY